MWVKNDTTMEDPGAVRKAGGLEQAPEMLCVV